MKSTDKFVLVLVASLALLLAGCGGGSSTPPEPEGPTPEEIAEMEAMQMRAMEQKADLEEANGALDTALAATLNTQDALDAANAAHTALAAAIEAAADVSAADKAMYEAAASAAMVRIADAQKIFEAAEAERMAEAEEQRKMEEAAKAAEMAKVGKALKAALGSNPLAHLDITPNTGGAGLAAAGLTVDQTRGTLTADPGAVTLSAGDSAGSLGTWSGTNYAHTNRGTGVSNSAVVYTNQAAPKSYSIATRYATAANVPTSGGTYTAGTGGKGTLSLAADSPDTKIMADMFPTVGSKTFSPAEGATEILVPGTYHGASGTYRCIGTCVATVTTGGGISLSDAWEFAHSAGAMVSVSDADYLAFGWWLNKDKDGEPTVASAFYSTVGTAPTALSGVNAIVGSATYAGKAAGKFAMSNPLDSTGDGGHFTADATLTAKFSGTGAGITGTIDNFMANDQSVPWSVALNNRTFDAAATATVPTPGNNISASGAITSPDNTTVTPNVDDSKTTIWSIDGNSAPASGTWSGQMYDETQGAADDGSNVPTTVLGRFQSEFGSVGSMVGAFGAEKE